MDRDFYSGLSDGCAPVDSEFLDSQTYGEYSADIKVSSVHVLLIH